MTIPAVIIAYVILSALVRLVVDRIRKRYPKINGDLVLVVAFFVTLGFCLLFGFAILGALAKEAGFTIMGDLPLWADYLGTAACVVAGTSTLADHLKKRAPTS